MLHLGTIDTPKGPPNLPRIGMRQSNTYNDKKDDNNDNGNKEDDDDDDGNKEDNDDNDDDDDDDDEGDNDNKENTNNDDKEGIFDLNDVKGMSQYELLRLRRIRRNEARLASFGLLEDMTSAASPSADRIIRKKRVATQGDFVRRIQPKRNVSRPTSYKDLDDSLLIRKPAHNTSIEGDISHSSIAGSGTVEDVPNARIVTPTGLEEVSTMFDLI